MSGSGIVIVISGTLPSGTSRKDKAKMIEAWGARVAKSVTNTCTHLVISDIKMVTTKIQAANKMNVQVIDEDTLDRMMGTFSASKSSSSQQTGSSTSSSSTTTSSKTKVKKSNANAGNNAKASGMTRPIQRVANSNTSSSSSCSRSFSAPQLPAPQPKANKKKRKASRPTKSSSSSSSSTSSTFFPSSSTSSSLPLPLKKKPRTKTVKSKQTTVVLNNGSLATLANRTVDPYVPIDFQPSCFNANPSGDGLNGSVYGK